MSTPKYIEMFGNGERFKVTLSKYNMHDWEGSRGLREYLVQGW